MRQLLLIVLVFLAALGSGCRSRKPDVAFTSPYPAEAVAAGEYAVRTEDDLLRALSERTRHHDEIWARSEVSFRKDGERGREFFTAIALFKAPDQIRLRGSRNPIGNLFDVLIIGEQAWLYFNREGRRFDGTLEELVAQSGAIGGLSPRELLSAIFVLQELNGWLASEQNVVSLDRGEHLLLAARHPYNRLQLFWLVRKQDALVEELLVRSPKGEELLRLRYTQYRLEQNPISETEEVLPGRFYLRIPGQAMEVEVDVREYKLHPGLQAAAFVPPPSRHVHPLSQLSFEEHQH